MLPWARGLAVRMAAWMQSLGLRGLFLAALHHLQNQQNQFEIGERLHVSAWYCFATMGPTLCDRLDDPSGSRPAHVLASGDHFWPCQAPAPIGAAAAVSQHLRFSQKQYDNND